MTYWLPPKLALPKNTKTLLFHDDCVDRGAAWAIHSSLTLHKEGDAYTLDTQAWNMLCYVRWQSYQKPDWTRRLANPTRSSTKTRRFGAYSLSTQDESGFLPTWEASDRYVILGLPFLNQNSWALSPDENRFKAFLVVRKEGDRYRIYPRTLRARHWDARCSTILRKSSMPRLERLWDAAFDALPAYAITEQQKHEGLPFVAGSLPKPPYQERFVETSGPNIHPYWAHAQHALCAAFGLENLAPPPPPDRYDTTYHWTVRSQQSCHRDQPSRYSPLPLSVDLSWDAWRVTGLDTEPPRITEAQSKSVARITRALATVLTAFAPDVPLFFDTVELNDRTSHGIKGHQAEIQDVPIHFPWMKASMLEGVGSKHYGLRHLAKLPKPWRDALVAAIADERARDPH